MTLLHLSGSNVEYITSPCGCPMINNCSTTINFKDTDLCHTGTEEPLMQCSRVICCSSEAPASHRSTTTKLNGIYTFVASPLSRAWTVNEKVSTETGTGTISQHIWFAERVHYCIDSSTRDKHKHRKKAVKYENYTIRLFELRDTAAGLSLEVLLAPKWQPNREVCVQMVKIIA